MTWIKYQKRYVFYLFIEFNHKNGREKQNTNKN